MNVGRSHTDSRIKLWIHTASLKTSNIPFAWFLVLGCNRQAQNLLEKILVGPFINLSGGYQTIPRETARWPRGSWSRGMYHGIVVDSMTMEVPANDQEKCRWRISMGISLETSSRIIIWMVNHKDYKQTTIQDSWGLLMRNNLQL